jgi:hypothetical protein
MMISTERERRQSFFKSCLLMALAVAGLLAACFVFCEVLFLLNQAGVPGNQIAVPIPTPTPAGGASIFLFLGI